MCNGNRGFSLVEALVACVVFLIVLTLIVQVVVPISKGSVRGSQQVDLQQTATMAMDQLARDLTDTPASGLALHGHQLACHPLVDVAADASQMYATDLRVWWWDVNAGRLWRKVWPPNPPSLSRAPNDGAPFVPDVAELNQIVGVSNGRERVMAAWVKDFQVVLGPASAEVHLALETPAPDGKMPERFVLDRRVYLPNAHY